MSDQDHSLDTEWDMDKINALPVMKLPTEEDLALLYTLVEEGPLHIAGDEERIANLIEMDFIVEVVKSGETGAYAATPLGGAFYAAKFDCNTIAEAILKRYGDKKSA
jgi:hypothetical protein